MSKRAFESALCSEEPVADAAFTSSWFSVSSSEDDDQTAHAGLLGASSRALPSSHSRDGSLLHRSLSPNSRRHINTSAFEAAPVVDASDKNSALCDMFGDVSSSPVPERKNRVGTTVPTDVCYRDRRGRYPRVGSDGVPSAMRLPHAEYAWNHYKQMHECRTGKPCDGSCPFDGKCPLNFTAATLICAHERVFGKVSRDEEGVITCGRSVSETRKQWRALMLSWITHSAADGIANENFSVEGVGPVCSRYARAVYFGLDARTKSGFANDYAWNTLVAAARAGNLRIDHDLRETTLAVRDAIGTSRDDQAAFDCINWWVAWLRLEDQAPNEPTIIHRYFILYTLHFILFCPISYFFCPVF